MHAARVRDGIPARSAAPLPELSDKHLLDPLTLSLHIHRMDQKFITVAHQHVKRALIHLLLRKLLPAIRHDKIAIVSHAAAQVQHKMFSPHCPADLVQMLHIDMAIPKHIRSHNHMGSSRLEIRGGIVSIDATADLESPGISCKRTQRLIPVLLIIRA